jgi:hypothetical protein
MMDPDELALSAVRFAQACAAIRPHPSQPHKEVPAALVARFIDVECALVHKLLQNMVESIKPKPILNAISGFNYIVPIAANGIQAFASWDEAIEKGYHQDQIEYAIESGDPLIWSVVVEEED